MHEMSVVTSLLQMVREEMHKHNVQQLLLVRVRYGVLTNIVPEALSFAFEALTQGTEFEGARLETEVVPLTLRCVSCGEEFVIEDRNFFTATCPSCHTESSHTIVGGRELYLQHIEAE